jgi:hypothetical protein
MKNFETELINAWCNTNGFLTRIGLQCLYGERTILASRVANGVIENMHIENRVKFTANSYLCDADIEERSEHEIKQRVVNFVQKFFTSEQMVRARNSINANGDWIFVLVIGEVRSDFEVNCLKELGIHIIDFKEVVNHAIQNSRRLGTFSDMKRILNVINYIKE